MSRSETARLWAERFQRFSCSQMTVAKFCQSEGVSQPSFYQWRKKLRQRSMDAEPKRTDSAVQFMPLRLPAQSGDYTSELGEHVGSALASTTIELPGGVRIRVEVPTNPQQVHSLEAGT